MWWFISILFLLSSLLLVIKAPTNLLWKFSVLFTEWSHFFALGTLILALSTIYLQHLSFVLFLISFLLFIYPSVFVLVKRKTIARELHQSFNLTSNQSIPPLPKFRFTNSFSIQPKQFTYSPGLALDFYRNKNAGKQPCVVVVHGGGWDSGDRNQLSELNYFLAEQGIAVASITYRLAPAFHFPAPLEDLHAAVQFLISEAENLGIEASHFFYLGRSAGGQVVLTEGYTNPAPYIKGIIAFYAPADMVWGYSFPCWKYVMDSRTIQANYMGGDPASTHPAYERASANYLVTKNAPPTLLLCGRNDVLTSFHHNTRLIEKLKPNQVPYYLLDIPYGVHGFDFNFNGPSAQLSTWCILEFIRGMSSR